MTYQFRLIGYPIKHSLSPWIHTQFFEMSNLTGTYELYEIEPDAFDEQIRRLKEININGFNVTVPYKEKIIPYLDELDEQAKHIGAVNTVHVHEGKWIGYNTDGIGYVRSLLSKFPDLIEQKSQPILMLGAGGAAKGIFHALVHYGFTNITIANRSLEKAKNIVEAYEGMNVITLEYAENNAHLYPLIIQTTSVGMKPNEKETIISLQRIHDGAIVSDIVYQPLMTELLRQGKQLGSHVHFGHTMLIFQAQYAFEIWTKVKPNAEQLDEPLKKILEG